VGTRLSGTQLDAIASFQGVPLPGTFTYTPAAGTVLSAGTHTLKVLFQPANSADFTDAAATVEIVVGNTGSTGVSGAPVYSSGDCCFFSQPTPYAITVSGSSVAPAGNVEVVFNGKTIGSGTLAPGPGASSSATLMLTSTYFYPGDNTVTLNYLGDTNYVPNSSQAIIPLRNPAIEGNPASVGGGRSAIEVPYMYVVAGAMTFNFNPEGGAISDFTNTDATTCAPGVQEPAGFICTFAIDFKPALPGVRKGVVEVDFTSSENQAEPKLYIFLSGLGGAAQIALSSATQAVLNSHLNQPQSVIFNPVDLTNSTLYVANSKAAQLDTLASSGGSLNQWDAANTTNLVYPSDLIFDAFGNLVVSDANAALVESISPALAETTVNTGTFTLQVPTAGKVDFGGNLYIADGGDTARIIEIPGEKYASYTPSLVNLGSQSVSFPQALAVDNTGRNLYVGDGNLNQILEVALDGKGASKVSLAPCDDSVVACAINSPAGFAFDPAGDMYITDSGARVLMVPITHSEGAPTRQLPLTGLLNPTGVTLDGSGDVYVSDLNGTVTKLLVNTGAMKFTTLGSSLITQVTNTGNLRLKITALTFASGASSSFTETNTCKSVAVAAGGTCTITVTYAKASGPASDTLTLTSNAFSAGGVTIQLSHP
jgi:sugar lactone lactonase YvrE